MSTRYESFQASHEADSLNHRDKLLQKILEELFNPLKVPAIVAFTLLVSTETGREILVKFLQVAKEVVDSISTIIMS